MSVRTSAIVAGYLGSPGNRRLTVLRPCRLSIVGRANTETCQCRVTSGIWSSSRPHGPLCHGDNGNLYPTYNKVYRAFVRECKRIGIPPQFTPHSLRHAFATALLANGAPLTDVSTWLGHESTEVTSRVYAHVIPSAFGRAYAILDAEFAEWSSPSVPRAA